MIEQMIPQIKILNKSEKIRLLQYLVTEIAKDEGIENDMNQEEEKLFWQSASQSSLDKIWQHPEEDIYNELL
ncbi:hypothetical protein [Cyanobacterium sp. Dongsha4]|uniref:hypothetical protein n=1 Tax=Cyanobacterium sp. DS4 TaxID=2878255 RepID=UPI002E80023A|nr:hypothetical protein [Cyanobacterium sp. Dongsha4]WVL02330.1 hypothetical protein Dongsha4_09155 [Cyanobacterium sp. Dongsha4]